jgi:ribosomal protein L37AE/L43A
MTLLQDRRPIGGLQNANSSASGAAQAARPEACPFCGSRAVDTLAKVITSATHWRCQGCGEGWTAGSARALARRG